MTMMMMMIPCYGHVIAVAAQLLRFPTRLAAQPAVLPHAAGCSSHAAGSCSRASGAKTDFALRRHKGAGSSSHAAGEQYLH